MHRPFQGISVMCPGLSEVVDEALNRHRKEPPSWRRFLRTCCDLVPTRLPLEAERWLLASDQYSRNEISESQLADVRVAAWRHHDQNEAGIPPSDLAALRMAMYGLWPDYEDWEMSLRSFIEFCLDAGIATEPLERAVRDSFL